MIFDAHCHIQFPNYDKDREEVIKRAQEAGVKMICVGTNLDDSEQAVELAEKYPEDIWATVGIHPNDISGVVASEAMQSLKNLAQNSKVVAIGECGLDFYRGADNKEGQKKVFTEQMEIAEELGKPLMIHCRPSYGNSEGKPAKPTDDAYEDLIEQLSTSNFQFSKIVHFFVGSKEVAKKLINAGCYFTFGGVITFVRDYDEVIKTIPLDRILMETDAPFVSPEPFRGKRNEPSYVIEVAKKLAEIKGVDYDKVIDQTTSNVWHTIIKR